MTSKLLQAADLFCGGGRLKEETKTKMTREVQRLLSHSPATRAVLSILRNVHATGCGGLSGPALELILHQRHAGSTVRASVRRLTLAELIAWTGKRVRLRVSRLKPRGGGAARVWRAI